MDFTKHECIVIGKGNKERTVYINDKAMYYLKQYLNTRVDSNDALFINSRGGRISKEIIRTRLNKISKIANIHDVYPHKFRRTMATNLSKHGMSIQCIQKILGHSKIDTTMIYCILDNDSVKNEYDKTV